MATTVSDIMGPQLIVLGEDFADKQQVLEHLSALLVEAGAVVDREAYLQAVREREDQGTTYVGHGVAIPHGKSEAVHRAAVAFAKIPGGIDFDGQGTAKLVFMIAAPAESDNQHLKVLALLARKLMHEQNRQTLMAAKTAREVIQVFEGEVIQ